LRIDRETGLGHDSGALATGEAEPEEAKEQPTEGEVRHAAAVALGR
jgi:hypothetical protein